MSAPLAEILGPSLAALLTTPSNNTKHATCSPSLPKPKAATSPERGSSAKTRTSETKHPSTPSSEDTAPTPTTPHSHTLSSDPRTRGPARPLRVLVNGATPDRRVSGEGQKEEDHRRGPRRQHRIRLAHLHCLPTATLGRRVRWANLPRLPRLNRPATPRTSRSVPPAQHHRDTHTRRPAHRWSHVRVQDPADPAPPGSLRVGWPRWCRGDAGRG